MVGDVLMIGGMVLASSWWHSSSCLSQSLQCSIVTITSSCCIGGRASKDKGEGGLREGVEGGLIG